jgi:hypothetical protein
MLKGMTSLQMDIWRKWHYGAKNFYGVPIKID